MLLLEFLFCQRRVYSYNFVRVVERNSIGAPVNGGFLKLSKTKRLQVLEVLDEVLRHFVDLIRVPGHLLVEDAAPHEGVQLVVWIFGALAIDEEVEVEVAPDGEHVVVDVLDFLGFSQDVHVLHLLVGHSVERVDQVLSELESKLVLAEISETLVNEPDVHIGDRMVDMKVVWDIHAVHKLPGVDEHQHPL